MRNCKEPLTNVDGITLVQVAGVAIGDGSGIPKN